VRGKALLTAAIEKNFTHIDRRTMSGEMVGHEKNGLRAVYSSQGKDKVIQPV
jgi:hypothetical protein